MLLKGTVQEYTGTVKKINLIQTWYLESRIQYLEFRPFLQIKFS